MNAKPVTKTATSSNNTTKLPAAPTLVPTTPKAEDQKAVKTEDQKTTGTVETPKKKRKFSAVHNAWKAQPDLPLTGKIKLLVKGNPKRQGSKSADRFALHEDGFTVQQYIDKCKKAGISEKLAMMDVRWDLTKKFISVS